MNDDAIGVNVFASAGMQLPSSFIFIVSAVCTSTYSVTVSYRCIVSTIL